MSLQSCLYEGETHHHRWSPIVHEFRYRLFLLYLDLEELPSLFRGRWFWSSTQPNIAWFRRADHVGPAEQPLIESVRDIVEERLGWRPNGPVRLLTHLRYFGFDMNPVSFYYCFDRQGQALQTVVAEVNNTPWNEQYCYVVDLRDQTASPWFTKRQPKDFHVSPFLKMDLNYDWRLNMPGQRLLLHIDASSDRSKLFDATLSLQRTELTRWGLTRILIRYPLMTLQVFAGIYWQALKLWLKRVPYVPKENLIDQAGDNVSTCADAMGEGPSALDRSKKEKASS